MDFEAIRLFAAPKPLPITGCRITDSPAKSIVVERIAKEPEASDEAYRLDKMPTLSRITGTSNKIRRLRRKYSLRVALLFIFKYARLSLGCEIEIQSR